MRYFILDKTTKKFRGDKVLDVAKRAAMYLFSKNHKIVVKFCLKDIGKLSKSYKYVAKKSGSKINVKKYHKVNKKLYGSADEVPIEYKTSILRRNIQKKSYKFQEAEAIEKNKIFESMLINNIIKICNQIDSNNLYNIERYFHLINQISAIQNQIKTYINSDQSYSELKPHDTTQYKVYRLK